MTGQSLYYPRVLMRTLAQVLTEEYSEHGVHVANVVIDGTIDSPGTRALPKIQQNANLIINPTIGHFTQRKINMLQDLAPALFC